MIVYVQSASTNIQTINDRLPGLLKLTTSVYNNHQLYVIICFTLADKIKICYKCRNSWRVYNNETNLHRFLDMVIYIHIKFLRNYCSCIITVMQAYPIVVTVAVKVV